MHNANVPNDIELPSSKQLIKSTIIALITALVLLVTVVLPAEYAIDPTGIGKVLGLTEMGEIKNQLALEAAQQRQAPVSEVGVPEAKEVAAPKAIEEKAVAKTPPTETRVITLKPGEAAEIKLGMKKGAVAMYEWSVNTGHVNYDTHGDGAGIKYFGYGKGRAVTEDKGELTAEFDGKHGWFWRNRSKQTVTVTLIVSGDYSGVYRVL
ncbi:MAG: transmembrane anchor protein [Calditrichia bacterium]